MFWNKLGKNWTNGGNVLSIWFFEQVQNGKYFKPTLRSGPIIENIGAGAVSYSNTRDSSETISAQTLSYSLN